MRLMGSDLGFPEGPIAEADGSVLLVEIFSQRLSRIRPNGRVERVAQLPGGPNGAALGPGGNIYVCNNGGFSWTRSNGGLRQTGPAADYTHGWIEVVEPTSGRVERLYEQCDGIPFTGPNDLVFDGSGGFWFTDLGKRRARDMDRGFVYWARADGSHVRQVASNLLTPNGIGLAPDGKTLYVAETETGRLWAFEVLEPGALRLLPYPSPNGGNLVAAPGGFLRLDGLAVTGTGRICVAALESQAIMEVTLGQDVVNWHGVPDLKVTNLCFGGQDMHTAFVTLSHRGELLAMRWHEPGLPLHHQQR